MTVVSLSNKQQQFQTEAIRSQFPIFVDNAHTMGLAYLDNAATTQKPQAVLEAIKQATESYHAPVNRGFYSIAQQSSDAYENARITVQEFIGAAQSESVIFTASATDSINQITQIYFADHIKPGQTIWVSRMEHHANFLPWQALAQQCDAQIKIIELTEDGELDFDRHPELFSTNSAVIAVTHTSNVIGTQNNIVEICQKAKAYDIPVVIDAAQAMTSNEINVADLGCDFLVFSGHKMYGPNGIGIMYIEPEKLTQCRPARVGGGMVDFVGDSFADNEWTEAPQMFEAGSPNLPAAVGLSEACHYINKLGKAEIKAHIKHLAKYAYEQLSLFENIIFASNPKHAASGIVSFHHKEIHAHDLAQILGDNNVAVRAGHHCAQPLLSHLQTSSTLRISCTIYNDTQDIDRAIEALKLAEEIFCL